MFNNVNEDITDNQILNNLEENNSDLDPDMVGLEEDEDPEALKEIEKLKEETLEEFLELAYQRKHDYIEEAKLESKNQKLSKEAEKKKIAEVTAIMDQKRKSGIVDIKKKLNQIIMNNSLSLLVKLSRLYDDEMKNYMSECLTLVKEE